MKYRYLRLLLFILLTFCGTHTVWGQVSNTFHLNIDGGLPSNLVYSIITDKHGYLWIATDKGVARYNGYDLKTFNLSDGLPNQDIWEMCEDSKGRIWLGSISNGTGYIYNNKYHKAFLKNFKGEMYPYYIRDVNGSVFFTIAANGQNQLCTEHNDTISFDLINDSLLFSPSQVRKGRHIYPINSFNNTAEVLFPYDDGLYTIAVNNKKTTIRKRFTIADSSIPRLYESVRFVVGDHLIFYNTDSSNQFYTINTVDGAARTINLDQCRIRKNILYLHPDVSDKTLYAITDDDIVKFDYKSELKYDTAFKIRSLTGNTTISGNKVHTIHNDPFWGNCVGTSSEGLWRTHSTQNRFTRLPGIDLDNYLLLGGMADSLFIWWNYATSSLAIVEKDFNITYHELRGVHVRMLDALLLGGDSFLLNGPHSYIYERKKKKLTEIPAYNVSHTIIDKNGFSYAITASGFKRTKLLHDHTIESTTLVKSRYSGLVYDSLRQDYYAYNYDNLFIHNEPNNRNTELSGDALHKFGIEKVEKIVVDRKYGNIFFKGNGNLTLYDHDKGTYSVLFPNYNLDDAKAFIYNNTLIVAGKFGVVFSKILGPQRISAPLLFSNIRNINYDYIYDCQISWGKIMMTTNKGLYHVAIPADNEILNHASDSVAYKFIINYKDTIYNIKSGDTIALDQQYLSLQFDVINPLGTGKPQYSYQLQPDSEWHKLNANELNLAGFPAGDYSTLSIIVKDATWASNKIVLHLYMQPHWWQTYAMRRLIAVAIVLLVVLLFAAAVAITRKLVLRASQKRNMRMELELKAIYAQINPHFIFNTLNTALLFVRKKKFDEAYAHISQFSRLLRSYIKSSRNKLITIADEITNLEDYLALQKTRFVDKFEFTILVSREINPNQIKIPSLLLQPFVENAINHGLLRKKDVGNLRIEFTTGTSANELICIVEDNGIGRKQASIDNKERSTKDDSYGDLLIEDLVRIFNKYEQMNITINYLDKEEPQTGTIVLIHIKNPRYD